MVVPKKASAKKLAAKKASAKKPAAKKTSAKKPAAKKTSAKKPAAKKASAKKPAAKKAMHGSVLTGKLVTGYKKNTGGILVPISEKSKAIVSASKLSAGLEASQAQIKKSLQGFASVFTQDFVVSEIELSVSFSAEGKFLGFGAGGDVSVKVKIRPIDDDA